MIRPVSNKVMPGGANGGAKVPCCERCGWQGPICTEARAIELMVGHECGAVL